MSVDVETFWGDDPDNDGRWSPYLTRAGLTDSHSLHVFHRGDADPDPHDHKRAFVTLPLTAYVEQVFDPKSGSSRARVVRAGRFHFRAATFAHRVLGRWSGQRDANGLPVATTTPGGIVTLVWWIGKRREAWGFWMHDVRRATGRRWVHWKNYVGGPALSREAAA
jgi:hypothetical protein